MKKAISLVLTVVILAGALFIGMPLRVSADSLYIRKVVSVVFDDSGSMSGAKYANANYAMQTFCGMLNSEDQLFITYMNDANGPNPRVVDLSAGKIQDSVDSIRNYPVTPNGTPFQAVESAFNKLTEVKDSDPNTQYWLVVITDGEFNSGVVKGDREELNQRFNEFADSTMPNGSNPQITFLAINKVTSPDPVDGKIHVFETNGSDDIIEVMSEMADRVSGRTRKDKSEITKLDDHTIQVKSEVPLLNIAVLSQRTDAVLVRAEYASEAEIPITRQASLSYPGYSNLRGGAFLIGDSKTPILKGTYSFIFDKSVDVDDVVVLFEPALEVKMTILLNGQEVSKADLKNAHAGDKISISYKICEIGSGDEVSPDLLPNGTTFTITIYEDGKVKKQQVGKDMTLNEFTIGTAETEIVASVEIEGINPLQDSVKFTPDPTPAPPPIPPVVYTIIADYGGSGQSVKYDDIASNKDMTIVFTILKDGVPITDPEEVKSLTPTVTASPSGNGGTTVVAADGKIVFTPNAASTPPAGADYFEVSVTCAIDAEDTDPATLKYTVLIASYEVFMVPASGTVKKTEFYGNTVGLSFYITKDGVKLDKSAVDGLFGVEMNKQFAYLKMNVTVHPDGTIECVPYDENEHHLNFFTWWGNWWYYLITLPGGDLEMNFSHPFGSASGTIDVVGESAAYILLNVVAPLALEIAILAFIAWWVYAFFRKPRFYSNAVLYTGRIIYNENKMIHEITSFKKEGLAKYNKFKYLWKPTLKPETFTSGSGSSRVTVTPDYCGRLICKDAVWYTGGITFITKRDPSTGATLNGPDSIQKYFVRNKNGSVQIRELSTAKSDASTSVKRIDHMSSTTYYIAVKNKSRVTERGNRYVIAEGTIFCYASETK